MPIFFYSVNNGDSTYQRVYLYSWSAKDVKDGAITGLTPVNNTYDGFAGEYVYNADEQIQWMSFNLLDSENWTSNFVESQMQYHCQRYRSCDRQRNERCYSACHQAQKQKVTQTLRGTPFGVPLILRKKERTENRCVPYFTEFPGTVA